MTFSSFYFEQNVEKLISIAEFIYNGSKYLIQCNSDEKLKVIIIKFLSKSENNKENLYYLYNGEIINEELVFNQCANTLDRNRNYISIVVIEGQDLRETTNNLEKSKYVICPLCSENAFISIENFKITIYGCKNGHKTERLQVNEFGKTQYVDQSQIKCNECDKLRSETGKNKFFTCRTCKHNLCPYCKDIHDKSHNNIIDYEENKFYCNEHFNVYKYYCGTCKKDICISCKNEHQEHNIITYDNIIPDIDKIRNEELKNTEEKIYELKTIINDLINQLNQLNKNLNIYFEIYNNIITNFDKEKRNYSIIQNINDMKKFNNNFIGSLTEIIKDNNIKNKFRHIINMQINMEFKQVNNNKTEMKEKNEIKIDKAENNKNNSIEKNDNIKSYSSSADKYENFDINKIKDLQSFKTQNYIEEFLVLNDRRILTIQRYRNEDGDKFYKLCVYSITKGYDCDINIDFEDIKDMSKMEDGNILFYTWKNIIKIIKIKKDEIEEIFRFKEEIYDIQRLIGNRFLVNKKEETGKKLYLFNGKEVPEYVWNHYFFLYDKGQFKCEKNLKEMYKNEGIQNVCQINENEYVLYMRQKGKIYGENDFIAFYDINANSITNKGFTWPNWRRKSNVLCRWR